MLSEKVGYADHRWEVLPEAIGNTSHATLFYNASMTTPGSANMTCPLRMDDERKHEDLAENASVKQKCGETGDAGQEKTMDVDAGDGELRRVEAAGTKKVGDDQLREHRDVCGVAEEVKEYVRNEGLGWLLSHLSTLQYKKGALEGDSMSWHAPRTVR